MWVGTVANIPTGWRLMDGVHNAIANGGTGYSFIASNEKRFPRFTDSSGEIGSQGGEREQTVQAGHVVADIAAILADHAAKNTGLGGAFSTYTDAAGAILGRDANDHFRWRPRPRRQGCPRRCT